jgi:hypothetical protein
MTDASEPTVKYEHSDAAPRLIASLAAAIILFLVLSPVLLHFAFPSAGHRPSVGAYGPVPAPVLQISPTQDLASFRREEEARLSSYGWIDRDHKSVRIPIERAKQLILERGLPDWPMPSAEAGPGRP